MNMKKTILVTGGTGYIGSHRSLSLFEEGFNVVIVETSTTRCIGCRQNYEQITGVKPMLEVFDIVIRKNLICFSAKYKDISAVIHFAGYKAVGESVNKPLDYYRNNLVSLINLLDSMKRHAIPAWSSHLRVPFTGSLKNYP